MSRNVAAALLVALIVAALAGLALAQEPTTQPAAAVERPAAGSGERATTVPASKADVDEAYFWARWGCIFAGLALVGVLWVGWSMRTLAKNQVEVARMIQAFGARQGD